MQFHRPDTLDHALRLAAEGPITVLAGGTDFFPARSGRTETGAVLDLTRVRGLKGITKSGATWRLGATTTWTEIKKASLPAQFKGLQLAAAEVGSIQIQNAGTIAGNLCNASPAADGVPPLLCLDALVELTGPDGVRVLPLAHFIKGARKTDLRPGEIVTAVLVEDRPAERSAFLKLGARRYLVISIAMAAAAVTLADDGSIAALALSVGSCSAMAQRLTELEAALVGLLPGSAAFVDCLARTPLGELAPIDDVRASAEYRLDAARTLIARTLQLAIRGGE